MLKNMNNRSAKPRHLDLNSKLNFKNKCHMVVNPRTKWFLPFFYLNSVCNHAPLVKDFDIYFNLFCCKNRKLMYIITPVELDIKNKVYCVFCG